MESKDKTYLMTGGTSDVGKAIAAGIAQRGANSVIVSRNSSTREQTVEEISEKSANKNISYLTADLSLMKSVYESGEQFKQENSCI